MSVQYTVEPPLLTAELIEAISQLCDVLFDRPVEDLNWRLQKMPAVSIACARICGRLVGFKLGYAHSQTRYYSWLGGVHPENRRNGISSMLTKLQHAWATERGFNVVETAADQGNVAMTQANLKFGFSICGLKHDPHRVQVLFSKDLS
jgi:Acetyltransferase (GNAT) domain